MAVTCQNLSTLCTGSATPTTSTLSSLSGRMNAPLTWMARTHLRRVAEPRDRRHDALGEQCGGGCQHGAAGLVAPAWLGGGGQGPCISRTSKTADVNARMPNDYAAAHRHSGAWPRGYMAGATRTTRTHCQSGTQCIWTWRAGRGTGAPWRYGCGCGRLGGTAAPSLSRPLDAWAQYRPGAAVGSLLRCRPTRSFWLRRSSRANVAGPPWPPLRSFKNVGAVLARLAGQSAAWQRG